MGNNDESSLQMAHDWMDDVEDSSENIVALICDSDLGHLLSLCAPLLRYAEFNDPVRGAHPT